MYEIRVVYSVFCNNPDLIYKDITFRKLEDASVNFFPQFVVLLKNITGQNFKNGFILVL